MVISLLAGREAMSKYSLKSSLGLKTLYKQINLTAGVHQVLNQLGPWRTMARVSLQRNPKPVFWNLRCWPILEKPTTKLRLRRKDFSIALSPEKTSKLRRSWAGFLLSIKYESTGPIIYGFHSQPFWIGPWLWSGLCKMTRPQSHKSPTSIGH